MLRHFLLLVPVAVAALALWNPLLSWLRDGVIYVSPQGSDWYSGRSPGSAVATIQRAADMVAAGETILILPGVYREEVRVRNGGAPGKPVIFRAAHPGTVTISGAAPDAMVERLDWRNEGGKIWSAATPWPIYHAVGDGENFFHVRWAAGAEGDKVYHWVGTEGRVARLRELVSRPKAWGAFAWEQGRLYVAFADGRSPRDHTLQINRAIPRPYASWSIRSANVWVEAVMSALRVCASTWVSARACCCGMPRMSSCVTRCSAAQCLVFPISHGPACPESWSWSILTITITRSISGLETG